MKLLLCPFKSALNTVVQAESMLFQCRFEALNWDERRAIIERAFSESNELLMCNINQQFRDILTTLTKVLDATLKNWSRIVEAKKFSVNVPFEHALSLVSARRVILRAGDAVIQEHHLPEFLAGMFLAVCEQGTAHFKRSAKFRTLHQDERMEIGLDLKEAIQFWSRHYVEPPGKNATCSHTWQANTSRLTYSVRHMYGQEGRRIDYTAHGCAQVQGNSLCPFTTDKFQAIYGGKQVEDMEDIAQLCENKQYIAACKLHMERIGKQLASEMVLQAEPFESRDTEYLQEPLVGIHKPSQFYFYIRKLTGLS
ncbi:hypothetical protein HPB52_016245 [Rhipicephalus sanguineus]|uniref:DNA primase large subunit C-terminal domain-containing protein n=1 Tax=Rhipicephalus sanguineus TaxID=34632 RepID=A0A9D4PBU3_RHISA|nr:hypothetical protein HPB52_016245 [Rhipicephalus sanguineus]